MESSPSHNPLIAYRPDIDGLRAVAVFAVILFHIDEQLLPGGFLGVDVFFVISGYLITLLLIKNHQLAGRLDLPGFYRRRLQRIYPAMLFLLAGVIPVSFLLMAPDDFQSLLMSALASLLSAANLFFLFTLDTGYFSPGTDDVPLLHLWSLGIEEQFYLIWPLMLGWILKKQGMQWKAWLVLLVLALVSVSLAHWTAAERASAAYFLIPTRAWELLAGAMAAFPAARGVSLRGAKADALAGTAVVLLLGSFLAVDESFRIPGLATVPAVLATVVLVLSAPTTCVGRILSLRPMVVAGLLSYSAYLWHWPILALLRYLFIEITWQTAIFVFTATFVMAAVSYVLVERPLRLRKLPLRTALARYLVVPTSVFAAFTLVFFHVNLWQAPYFYDWSVYRSGPQEMQPSYQFDFNCLYDSRRPPPNFSEDRCVYPPGRKPAVLLVGDSNAAHYLGLLRTFSEKYGFAIRNATQSACPPLLVGDTSWVNQKFVEGCDRYRKMLAQEFASHDVLVVGAVWDTYDRLRGEKFRSDVDKTVEFYANSVKRVVLLANVPMFDNYSRECEKRRLRVSSINCRDSNRIGDRTLPVNLFLERLSEKYSNVHYFDPRHMLCGNGFCSPYIDGTPVYFDRNHLSMSGSILLGKEMLEQADHVGAQLGRFLSLENDVPARTVLQAGPAQPVATVPE